jgi:hypothetical protein
VKTDYDSPWKDILEIYFQSALKLCFPQIARQINWGKGVQLLSNANYPKRTILDLFSFVDWVMVLPGKLEREFDIEHTQFEEARSMKYVTNIERRGIEKGRQEGQIRSQQESVLAVLETRFGEIPYDLREVVTVTDDLARLKRWHRLAIQLASLAEFETRRHKR